MRPSLERFSNVAKRKSALGATAPLVDLLSTAKRDKAPPKRSVLMLSFEVAERLRDAAHHERRGIQSLSEQAIIELVERLEMAHGEIFPPRPPEARRNRR